MPKYNELMLRPGANLNRLLAWQHATALDQALNEKWVPWGLLDQFSEAAADPARTGEEGGEELRTEDAPRAEEDPVVAAASVVARAEYVRVMKQLSQRFGGPLQKGASAKVKEQAAQIIEKFGARRAGRLRQAALPHGLRSRRRRGQARRAAAAGAEGADGMESELSRSSSLSERTGKRARTLAHTARQYAATFHREGLTCPNAASFAHST